MALPTADYWGGLIEGFYGAPWAQADRLQLIAQLPSWGLNTYMYAPKDDLKHRAHWRDAYNDTEFSALAELISACQKFHIQFIYGISPGLDIRYTEPGEMDCLEKRLGQLQDRGCRCFALLFDDIPDQLNPAALTKFGSLAAAQCHVVNELWRRVRQRQPDARFLFCPTPYCGRMQRQTLGGMGYLETLGEKLTPDIDIFWTGPEIISREIPLDHIRELRRILRRPPVIWDNLHANDYDGRRFYCGPYSGRPLALRREIKGVLSNPNNEFPLNFIPLRTLGNYLNADGSYDPRQAYLKAMEAWRQDFAGTHEEVALDDLILLGDCYYLPHEEGPRAQELRAGLEKLCVTPAESWSSEAAAFLEPSARLRRLCAQLTELRYRSLFHALSRRIWELREELDLLEQFVRFRKDAPPGAAFRPDSHLPGTYRGGFVPGLQRLLHQLPDGSFRVTQGADTPPAIPTPRHDS